MSDTASLVVRVSSQGASAVNRELSSLAGTAKSAAAAVGLVVSAGAAMSKLVQTARQTDVLMASLKTMTGSSEAATAAFGELNKIAAETPYTIDQSVTAFTKLVSLGLDPSKKAIISYGNTASAMGKDLTQMIEAVADASTGEFERLKEFGIKAKQQGDQVSFTFQGVTTTVGKNAAEIEGYLQGLGENQFAGAMANRMATLDGALSNLQDSWDGLFRAVSSAGTGDIIAEQVRMASDALAELTASISSGEALAYIQAWGGQWEGTATDVRSAIEQTTQFMESTFQDWGLSAEESSNLISDAFWQFPANIRAAVQVATVEIAALVDKAAIQAKRLDSYLTPSNWFNDDVDIAAYYDKQLANIDSARASSVDKFMKERDQRIGKLNEETDAAKKLSAAYDEKQKDPALDLGQFRVGGDSTKSSSTAGGSSKASKQVEADAIRLQSQKDSAAEYLERLRQDNMTELQIIDTQEQEKLAKVNEFRKQSTNDDGTWKANALISEESYQSAITNIHKAANDDRAQLRQEALDKELQKRNEYQEYFGNIGQTEFDQLKERQDEKLRILDEYYKSGLIGYEEYQSQMSKVNSDYAFERLKQSGEEFGSIASNMKTALGEASGAYKAFAIAQATIATYTGAIEAYKSAAAIPFVGWVMGPVAAAATVAAGLANIAKIRSAREQGGGMTAGSAYQMAERGKAEVIVPAGNSRARTAEQMREIMGQNGGSQIQGVTIVNNTTGRVDNATTEVDNEGMLRIIIDEHVSNALMTQDSAIAKARRSTSGQPGY